MDQRTINKVTRELEVAFQERNLPPALSFIPRNYGHLSEKDVWLLADTLTVAVCKGSECYEVFSEPDADGKHLILTNGEYR